MALIKCPECKKKISSQCGNCPNCGFPITMNIDELSVKQVENKQHLYKKPLLWVAIVLIVVAIIAFLFLVFSNQATKPKVNDDGSPKFVEMTNEVYTNADDYLGYYIDIKGKVFQAMSDNGTVKGIQVWLDPDTCEQNLMIYYNTDVEVKQGDYIVCSGYIDSVTEYKNAYDAKLFAPLVISSNLKKSTYMEVMAPVIETIAPKNLKQEKYGYSVSIDKIEFAERETRIYTTIINNGNSVLYFGDSVIVQEGKQYNSTSNYEAEYEEIPYEIVKGASCSGIIVFPTINIDQFELSLDIHSENYDEDLGDFIVSIDKEKSEIKTSWSKDEEKTVQKPIEKPIEKPTYPSAVGTYYYISDYGWDHKLHIYNDGTLYVEYYLRDENSPEADNEPCPLEGTWTQNEETITYSVWNTDGFMWNNPFYDTVYNDGIDFLGDYYKRQ